MYLLKSLIVRDPLRGNKDYNFDLKWPLTTGLWPTLLEPKVSAKISPHKPDLHFLMRNDLYFHMGYAPKIKSGASHNIKFQKTKFSQKITSKNFFKVIFLEMQSCIHVFWPNCGNKFLIFFENLTKKFQKK